MHTSAHVSRGLFVTGTDTGVGKTVVSALLCRLLEAAYFKPVQSGADQDDDTAAVARLAELPADRVFPPAVRLAAPLSPAQAAAREGRVLDQQALPLPRSPRPLVVEGAGGVLVPIAPGLDMAGLMARYGLPVVVAARSGLGTVNHTLLTLEALRARGLSLAGVILCGPENPENVRDIERLGGTPILFTVPVLDPLTPQALAALAARLPWPPPAEAARDDRSAEEIASLDARHVWHPFTQAQTADPAVPVVRARGAKLFTADGWELVDLACSWWVNLHGHAHPAIAEAVARQAHTLEQVIFADFTHEPAARLAERLCALLPGDLDRVFYSDDGSTAVEAALKMAHQYWRNQGQPGRTRFAAFQGGYHGDTVGAMSVGFSSGFYQGFENLAFRVDFLPYPATWLDDPDVEEKEAQALAVLENYLTVHASGLAGVIAEPLVQGASGMRMTRPEFLRALADRTARAGTLLILDEVMTGFGRTGAMFACLKAGVSPDLVCLSKGITGGFMPLAATVATRTVYEAFLGQTFDRALAHGHSYTGNPLGCAAGLASLDLFAREDTLGRVARLEAVHRERLAALKGRTDLAKPRLTGSIGAVDVLGRGTGYDAGIGKKLKRYFMDRGLYVRPMGDVFYFMPPYCLEPGELHRAYDMLEEALDRIA